MTITVHPPGQPPQPATAPAEPAATTETPSQAIVRAATEMRYVTDRKGRRIGWRALNALEDFDLVEIAGENNNNAHWMIRASIAFSIREIDGEPVSRPLNKTHIRAMIQRLGAEGMDAIMEQLLADQPKKPGDDPDNPMGAEAETVDPQTQAGRDRAKN